MQKSKQIALLRRRHSFAQSAKLFTKQTKFEPSLTDIKQILYAIGVTRKKRQLLRKRSRRRKNKRQAFMLAVINVALRRRIGGVAGLANSEHIYMRACFSPQFRKSDSF